MHPHADADAPEQVRRERVAELRRQIVDLMHESDVLTRREVVGCVLAGPVLGAGLLLLVFASSDNAGDSRTFALVLSALLLLLAAAALRPWVRSRRALLGRARVLRAEEKAVAATLPDDPAGRGVWSTYYRERFSNPVVLIGTIGGGVVLLVQLLR